MVPMMPLLMFRSSFQDIKKELALFVPLNYTILNPIDLSLVNHSTEH